MGALFTASLEVPPEAGFETLIRAFALDAGHRAGIAGDRSLALAETTLGCYGAIVAEAMAESRAPIKISAHGAGDTLTVSLLERGLPLDDAESARDPRWAELLATVDSCCWHAHGTGGSELRMTVDVPPHASADANTDEGIDPHDSHEEPPATPSPHTYIYRRAEPRDAAAIARIFYRTYGYHYTPTLFYKPDQIVSANERGRYTSFVAEAENGEIAAHYAIRPDNDATGEGCAAVVLPEHRGHDVITQARATMESGAHALDLLGYYTEPVTTHPYTQKASAHFGATICAIALGSSPCGLRPTHMDVTITDQRQSLTFYAKMLRDVPTRVVHAPAKHRAMIASRYERLGLSIETRDGAAPHGRGTFSVSFARGKETGTVRVSRIGATSATVIRQAVADLRSVQHAKAIYALLPLDDPGTPSLADALERDGFFFGGIEPLVLDDGRDALLLQLPLTHIDTSELVIEGDDGKALLAYIEAQRSAR